VNFGPLAAEIVSLVWGTPDNFNGFRVLAALLHGTLVNAVLQQAPCLTPLFQDNLGKPAPERLKQSAFNEARDDGVAVQ